jgi:putative transposase
MGCCSIAMLAIPSGGMTAGLRSMSAIGAGVPMASRSAATMARGCDCCDREAISFLATTGGISADDVPDLMVAAVEHRFGRVNRLPFTIEWLSDNGSCYIAGDTRSFARDIGLEPRTTPIESPQSNGIG